MLGCSDRQGRRAMTLLWPPFLAARFSLTNHSSSFASSSGSIGTGFESRKACLQEDALVLERTRFWFIIKSVGSADPLDRRARILWDIPGYLESWVLGLGPGFFKSERFGVGGVLEILPPGWGGMGWGSLIIVVYSCFICVLHILYSCVIAVYIVLYLLYSAFWFVYSLFYNAL